MLDAIPQQPIGQPEVGRSPRKNFIPCRQCTENFPKSSWVCPRCSRINDRNPLVFASKVFAVVVFVFTLCWVVRAVATNEPPQKPDNITTRSQPAVSASSAEQEIRF